MLNAQCLMLNARCSMAEQHLSGVSVARWPSTANRWRSIARPSNSVMESRREHVKDVQVERGYGVIPFDEEEADLSFVPYRRHCCCHRRLIHLHYLCSLLLSIFVSVVVRRRPSFWFYCCDHVADRVQLLPSSVQFSSVHFILVFISNLIQTTTRAQSKGCSRLSG